MSALNVLWPQLTRDLFAIAKFLFHTKRGGDISTGTPLTEASNAGGVGKKRDSGQISDFAACRSTVRVAKCEKQSRDERRQASRTYRGVRRPLFAQEDDEVFVTGSTLYAADEGRSIPPGHNPRFLLRAVLTCLGALGPPGWWGPMGKGGRRSTFYQSGSDMTNCEMGLKLPKSMKSEDWRLNWRDMNIAQKLWDSTVGSHSWRGSIPHPLSSNPGANIVLCVGLFQMQTAKLKSTVYSS